MEVSMSQAPLTGFRALDLTDEKGLFCGRVLADFGVEVIQVESPQGNPARVYGPSCQDPPDPEKGLWWLCYAGNKKGITLNVESREGKQIFRRLATKADFVIESFYPGYMDELGLGYASLSQLNPSLVMTSITPFGQEGPYKDYKGSDLVCWSLGGFTWITGDPDRPPVGISFPQAYLNGALEGAVATMVAHYHRVLSDEGQYVDVSIQASVARDLMNAPIFYDLLGTILKRGGAYRVGMSHEAGQRTHWECKDGYISFFLMGGLTGAATNQALVEYMDTEGGAPQFMKDMNWREFSHAAQGREFFDKIADSIGKFFKAHTKQELYKEAVKRRMTLYPLNDPKDVTMDAQLDARGFWEEVVDPEIGTVKYPGAPTKFSETPCPPRQRAPRLGEHNQEIYMQELGFNENELAALKKSGVI